MAVIRSFLEVAVAVLRVRSANIVRPSRFVRRLEVIESAVFPSLISRIMMPGLAVATFTVTIVSGETLVIKATPVKTLALEAVAL